MLLLMNLASLVSVPHFYSGVCYVDDMTMLLQRGIIRHSLRSVQRLCTRTLRAAPSSTPPLSVRAACGLLGSCWLSRLRFLLTLLLVYFLAACIGPGSEWCSCVFVRVCCGRCGGAEAALQPERLGPRELPPLRVRWLPLHDDSIMSLERTAIPCRPRR